MLRRTPLHEKVERCRITTTPYGAAKILHRLQRDPRWCNQKKFAFSECMHKKSRGYACLTLAIRLMSATKARGRAMFALSGRHIYSRTAPALAPVRRGPLAAVRMKVRAVCASRALCAVIHLSHSCAEVCHAYKECSKSRSQSPCAQGPIDRVSRRA